jgi:hypothetical protein
MLNKFFITSILLAHLATSVSLGANKIYAAISPNDPRSSKPQEIPSKSRMEEKIAFWDSIVEKSTSNSIPIQSSKGVTLHGENLPVLVRILNTDFITTEQPYTLKFTMNWQTCRSKSSSKYLSSESEASSEEYTPYPPIETYGFSHDNQYSRFDSGDLNLKFSARLVQLIEPNYTVKTIAELGTYPATEVYPSNAESCKPGVPIASSKIYSLTFRLDQAELPKSMGPVYFVVNGTTVVPTRSNLKGFQGFSNIGITSH